MKSVVEISWSRISMINSPRLYVMRASKSVVGPSICYICKKGREVSDFSDFSYGCMYWEWGFDKMYMHKIKF